MGDCLLDVLRRQAGVTPCRFETRYQQVTHRYAVTTCQSLKDKMRRAPAAFTVVRNATPFVVCRLSLCCCFCHEVTFPNSLHSNDTVSENGVTARVGCPV